MLGYHGTTMDALLSIIDKGQIWNIHSEELWICSESGVYFWDPVELDSLDEALFLAKSNAAVGLVTAKHCRRVILELDVTDLEVWDDQSCEHMNGAMVHYGPIPTERIRRVWVDSDDLSLYRLHILADMVHMPLYNMPNIPAHVIEIAENTTPCDWGDYHEPQEMKGLDDEALKHLIASL